MIFSNDNVIANAVATLTNNAIYKFLKDGDLTKTLPQFEWVSNRIKLDGVQKKMLEDMHTDIFGRVIITNELLNDLISICKGKRVIDIGCGNGYIVELLKSNGVDIVGVDLSSDNPNVLNVDANLMNYYAYDIVINTWNSFNMVDILSKFHENHIFISCNDMTKQGCTFDDDTIDYIDNNMVELKELSKKLNLSSEHLSPLYFDTWNVYKTK